MRMTAQPNLFGLDLQELTGIASSFGQPPYRGGQLFAALYRNRTPRLDLISNLPLSFRKTLIDTGYQIDWPTILKQFESVDRTIRYLIGFSDGQSVETVWMPEGDGGEAGDGSDAENEE